MESKKFYILKLPAYIFTKPQCNQVSTIIILALAIEGDASEKQANFLENLVVVYFLVLAPMKRDPIGNKQGKPHIFIDC